MTHKLIFTILAIALTTGLANAQKMQLKKGKVLLDNREIYRYKKELLPLNLYVYHLHSDEQVISIQNLDNETPEYPNDDYIRIYFSQSKQLMESNAMAGASFKKILTKLAKFNVIQPDGSINEEKLEDYLNQFDENVTNRTIRQN